MSFKNSVAAVQNAQDASQILMDVSNANIGAGITDVWTEVDTSAYSSWYGWFGFDPAVGSYLRFRFTWLDVYGSEISRQEYTINSQGVGSPTSANGAFVRAPAFGESLIVSVTNIAGGVAGNYSFRLFGSLRVVTKTVCYESPVAGNDLFAAQILPGATTTTTSYFPLFSGNVCGSFRSIGGTAGQQVRVQLLQGVTGGVLFDRTYTVGTTPDDFGLLYIFPRVPCRLTVQNLGAVVSTGIRTQWISGESQ